MAATFVWRVVHGGCGAKINLNRIKECEKRKRLFDSISKNFQMFIMEENWDRAFDMLVEAEKIGMINEESFEKYARVIPFMKDC